MSTLSSLSPSPTSSVSPRTLFRAREANLGLAFVAGVERRFSGGWPPSAVARAECFFRAASDALALMSAQQSFSF
ncbi:unnamed protein product [Ectocarpus sp. CCAP 1310/34]|nr:unnamed protein product [Ectocarpus sp. CCAP 1310/34]